MQLHEAFELVEIFGAVEATQYLQKGDGWKLLAVTPVTSPYSHASVGACYVLGRPHPQRANQFLTNPKS